MSLEFHYPTLLIALMIVIATYLLTKKGTIKSKLPLTISFAMLLPITVPSEYSLKFGFPCISLFIIPDLISWINGITFLLINFCIVFTVKHFWANRSK